MQRPSWVCFNAKAICSSVYFNLFMPWFLLQMEILPDFFKVDRY